MVDAVVLAGGTIPERETEFRAAVRVECKSLIPLRGRIMVARVIDALRASEEVRRVAVVGPAALREHPDCSGADVLVPEAEGRSENLFLALRALPDADRILMLTSDLALVEPQAIDDFVRACPPATDIAYALVREATVLRDFADRPPPPPDERGRRMPPWVVVEMRDGRFTGTPCLLFRPAAVQANRDLLKSIFDDRHLLNVVRALTRRCGVGFLLRVALALRWRAFRNLVSIDYLERRVGRALGARCQGYVSPFAELAFDVDHLGDLALAERVLGTRA